MEQNRPATDPKAMLGSILEIFKAVIISPATFYRQMQTLGGYADPFIFAVVMGAASGIVRAVLGMGFSLHIGIGGFLVAIIIGPILTGLFAFVGAAILFVIWQLMGSRQSYETAYRCLAYALAISPITAALNFIPYLGALISLGCMAYILVCASVEVHGIEVKAAWIVFGAIAALLALGSLSLQHSARSFQHSMQKMGKGLSDVEKMKPEDAGQAVGEFLKGMQKGMDKK
jgi:hypothetical protein